MMNAIESMKAMHERSEFQPHTPGPWINWSDDTQIDVGNGDGPVSAREIQGHYNHETGDGSVIGYAFTAANARLIAAAPVMLDELQKTEASLTAILCSRVLDSTQSTFLELRRNRDAIRAAIHLATQGSGEAAPRATGGRE